MGFPRISRLAREEGCDAWQTSERDKLEREPTFPPVDALLRFIAGLETGSHRGNFCSHKSRPARKSSAVQLSHAPLIATRKISNQQHALEEQGTVQFQPCAACKRRTVAQAARPAAEPCVDDARITAAQPSSPAPRVASPAKAHLRQHDVPPQTAPQPPRRPSCSPPLLCTWMDGPEAP